MRKASETTKTLRTCSMSSARARCGVKNAFKIRIYSIDLLVHSVFSGFFAWSQTRSLDLEQALIKMIMDLKPLLTKAPPFRARGASDAFKGGFRKDILKQLLGFPLFSVSGLILLSAGGLTAVEAAGFGGFKVLSATGQPFSAEIGLITQAGEDPSKFVVRLVNNGALPTTPALVTARFTVKREGSGPYFIQVATDKPIQDAFVTLFVELQWEGGNLFKKFTGSLESGVPAAPPEALSEAARVIAVDPNVAPMVAPIESVEFTPPVVQAEQSASPPEIVAEALEQPASSATRIPGAQQPEPATPSAAVEARPAKTFAPLAVPADGSEALDRAHQVRAGDTLSRIAGQYRYGQVSLDQMLVGLYRANPKAFENNLNRLKTGVVLQVPSQLEVQRIAPEDARAQIQIAAADWRAYRQSLASAAPRVPSTAAGRSRAAPIKPHIVDQQPSGAPADHVLKVTKGIVNPHQKNKAALATEKADALADERVSTGKAVEEVSSRVSELKKINRDLKELVSVKNQAFSESQKRATVPGDAVKKTAIAEKSASTVAPAPQTVEKAASTVQELVASMPTVKPLPPAPIDNPFGPPAPIDNPFGPPAPQGFRAVLADPVILGSAAFGLALLLGLVIRSWKVRRAKKQPKEAVDRTEETVAPTPDQEIAQEALLDPSNAAERQPVTAEKHDAVADAEAYLAYGREAQAIQVLQEALLEMPDRADLRLKLIEILAQKGDEENFSAHLFELHQLTQAQGPFWRAAVALGRKMNVDHPLLREDPTTDDSASPIPVESASTRSESLGELRAPLLDFTQENDEATTMNVLEKAGPMEQQFLAESHQPEEEAPLQRTADLAPTLDLAGISLDLNEPYVNSAASTAFLKSLVKPLSTDGEHRLPEREPVYAKLELAKAYAEMGDHEIARELLQEVTEEGNAQQRGEAEQLLQLPTLS